MSEAAASTPDVSTRLRGWVVAILAIVAVGMLVRVWPFIRYGGAERYPVDNDEGVYFTAACMLVQGYRPYRDFVFAHPPGILLAFAPAALAVPGDPMFAFALARWGSVVIGALNLLLVWRIAARWGGPRAGTVAALLYAVYPEAALAERSTAIEPLLNLLVLAMADAWLRPAPLAFSAGVFAGCAFAVKLWAAPWILAALFAAPPDGRRAAWLRFVSGGAVALVLVAGPLVMAAPGAFLEQVIRLHSRRPPDGALGWTRVAELWNVGHGAATALAVATLVTGLGRAVRDRREYRLFATAYILVACAFLAAPGFWRQYNAHLAACECVLAGVAGGSLAGWAGAFVTTLTPGPRRRLARAGLVALGIAALAPSLLACRSSARLRPRDMDALLVAIREHVPAGARLFAFEPGWGLLAGRLPGVTPGVEIVVDPWSQMMLEVARSRQRYGHSNAAWDESEAWRAIVPSLEASDFVACGWRGRWQLGVHGRAWFEVRFTRVWERHGQAPLDLWRRR